MPLDEVSSALRFLTDAGHLLASASPQTSAFLLNKRGTLIFENEVALPEKERQHVCTCCGHIMLLGLGSNIEFRSQNRAAYHADMVRKRRPGMSKQAESPAGPTKRITCGHCRRVTEVKLPAPNPISRRNTKAKLSRPLVAEIAPVQTRATKEELPEKGNANSSSKKRAKTRKAGLQALLDQSGAAKGSKPGLGLGLSLADFMQK